MLKTRSRPRSINPFGLRALETIAAPKQFTMISMSEHIAGIVGLANDELGYILPVEIFKYLWNPFKPGKHYEETNSIGKEIAPKVMSALDELLL